MANNVKISGRIASVTVNEKNNRTTIRLVHNFGGDVDALGLDLVAFKNKKGAWPAGVEGLKKGDNIIVNAFQRPNNFTNESGEVKYRTQLLVKNIALNEKNESVNDVELSGRLAADPAVNEAGSRTTIRLIHNFGGDLAPLGVTVTAFKDKKGAWPAGVEGLKKGDNIIVKAFQRTNNYTNAEGEKIYRVQVLAKSVEMNSKPEAEEAKEQKEEKAAEKGE